MGAVGARSEGLGAIGKAVAAAVLLLSAWRQPAEAAESLPAPQGAPILIVDGGIAVANAGEKAAFDLALLKTLPHIQITTDSPWTEGETEFDGVRLRDLLARLGATGQTVVATAADEYRISIPTADARQYDVIIAYAANGRPLRPDDKGPLWLIYPFSANPGLKKDLYFSRCVWQLSGLTVR